MCVVCIAARASSAAETAGSAVVRDASLGEDDDAVALPEHPEVGVDHEDSCRGAKDSCV